MPNAGAVEADRLLEKLLTLMEAKPAEERVNRIMVRMTERSWLSEDREALYQRLKAAAACGAVELEYGRLESRHLITRVVLRDGGVLYGFLGRTPQAEKALSAVDQLRERVGDLHAVAPPLLNAMEECWRRGQSIVGLGAEDLTVAEGCLRAIAALVDGTLDNLDLRTFSRRATRDSKFVEVNMGRIVDLLRRVVEIPEELTAEEVLASHGITRYPQPCLLAGPITYQDHSLPAHPYIGIPPEMIAGLGVNGSPSWILTIENLASFNRQVREAPGSGIVLYSGGFPSRVTLDCLRRLSALTDCPIFHWGDIDAGGVKIAFQIECGLRSIGRRLKLHLMTADLAGEFGHSVAAINVFKKDVSASVVSDLACYLAGSEAHILEQEELDPCDPVSDHR